MHAFVFSHIKSLFLSFHQQKQLQQALRAEANNRPLVCNPRSGQNNKVDFSIVQYSKSTLQAVSIDRLVVR